MYKKALKTGKIVMPFLFTALLAGTSCKKDKEDTFELPPESAFVMDLSTFAPTQKSTENNNLAPETKIYFTAAVVHVGFWSSVVSSIMAIPVASYIEAFNHKPERVEDNKWKWSYTVEVLGVDYTASLYGEIVGEQIEWEMYISMEGGFTEFLWYEGTCNITRTEGSWTLYKSYLSPVACIEIDWNYDWDDQTGDVKYTYVEAGVQGNGNYIQYGITAETDYNTYYNMYESVSGRTVQIKYNTDTHEGTINYSDTWYCWDSQLEDTTCP